MQGRRPIRRSRARCRRRPTTKNGFTTRCDGRALVQTGLCGDRRVDRLGCSFDTAVEAAVAVILIIIFAATGSSSGYFPRAVLLLARGPCSMAHIMTWTWTWTCTHPTVPYADATSRPPKSSCVSPQTHRSLSHPLAQKIDHAVDIGLTSAMSSDAACRFARSAASCAASFNSKSMVCIGAATDSCTDAASTVLAVFPGRRFKRLRRIIM